MPSLYAPCGHRVTFTDTRPTKCPTCGGPMQLPPPPLAPRPASNAAYAPTYAPTPASAPSQKVYAWELPEDQVPAHPDDHDLGAISTARGMDISVHRNPREGELMSIGDLKEVKEPIGRVERASRAAPEGGRQTTAAELVREMLKDRPMVAAASVASASVLPATPAPRPRTPRKPRAKRTPTNSGSPAN